MRLYLQRSTKPVRQNSFGIRIVIIWNDLSENVVNLSKVNTFKDRLDKHWENLEILFKFKLKITIGTSEILIGKVGQGKTENKRK